MKAVVYESDIPPVGGDTVKGDEIEQNRSISTQLIAAAIGILNIVMVPTINRGISVGAPECR
jgi:hypothetical protein